MQYNHIMNYKLELLTMKYGNHGGFVLSCRSKSRWQFDHLYYELFNISYKTCFMYLDIVLVDLLYAPRITRNLSLCPRT
jgi:hypothetical protein